MKSGIARSLLALALGMVGAPTSAGKAYRLRPSAPVIVPSLIRPRDSYLAQSPRSNQRKIRKARRQRFAAGDRTAFR